MYGDNEKTRLYIVLFLHQTTTADGMTATRTGLYIVLFLHQTTTLRLSIEKSKQLYIVLFLHQTTTLLPNHFGYLGCISYYSYIKPQPQTDSLTMKPRCISYYSYIKPQPGMLLPISCTVVYRTIPTSNHNLQMQIIIRLVLYIVLFLHQTTTTGDYNLANL